MTFGKNGRVRSPAMAGPLFYKIRAVFPEKKQIGAGAPCVFWQIGAKAACTNPEKNDTVKPCKPTTGGRRSG